MFDLALSILGFLFLLVGKIFGIKGSRRRIIFGGFLAYIALFPLLIYIFSPQMREAGIGVPLFMLLIFGPAVYALRKANPKTTEELLEEERKRRLRERDLELQKRSREKSSLKKEEKTGQILGAVCDSQGNRLDFKISSEERLSHLYIIGGTGTGKSKALEGFAYQDLKEKRGFGVLDPHGDLVNSLIYHQGAILDETGGEREEEEEEEKVEAMQRFIKKRVVLIDPTFDNFSFVGFNPLEVEEGQPLYPQALELIGVFKKIWADNWGPRMEDILRNSFLTLMENNLTLLETRQLLTDDAFRSELTRRLENEGVKEYWEKRFNPVRFSERQLWIDPVLNKVNAFIADPQIRFMVGQQKSTVNFREIMDSGKVLLINLARGTLKENTFLLGALFMAKLQLAALSRSSLPPQQRKPFYLYIDEFQNFATESFIEILAESRKYGLGLVLAHQNLDQLNENLKASILANAKTHLYFRLSRRDAEVLVKEAFEVSGEEVKCQLYQKDGLFGQPKPVSNPVFYSQQEEWEWYIKELTNLESRFCCLKVKGEDPQLLRIYDMYDVYSDPRAEETIGYLKEFASGYMRDKFSIEEEIKGRREALYKKEKEPEIEEEIE